MKAAIYKILRFSLLLKLLCNLLSASAEENAEISRIKAAYIYHFATFAQWPDEARSASPKEIRLCALGDNEVTAQLQLLDGKNLAESRTLRVVLTANGEISKACHMVFLGESTNLSGNPAWQKLRGSPILWVSDQSSFAQQGGMIEMFLRDDKIRMRINLATVRQSGIVLSSKLLRLAEIVETP